MSAFPDIFSDRQHSVRAPGQQWSARHSQQGCQGMHGMGAASHAPRDAAPLPVSTVAISRQEATPLSAAPAGIVAVLTTFEGQAVLKILTGNNAGLRSVDIFRLRKGSRVHRQSRLGS